MIDELFPQDGSLLNLFLGLLAWTRDHGLHVDDNLSTTDDPKHIDWKATFDRGMALHFKTGMAFSNVYGDYSIREPSSLAVAQAMALTNLFDELEVVSHLWISRFDPIIEECRDLLVHTRSGEKDIVHLRRVLAEADLHANKDHERDLIALLRLWVSRASSQASGPTLFGVNAFHAIWEDMCAVALGTWNASISHADVAHQPWFKGDATSYGLGTQRPDVLVEHAGLLIIGDAKWYRQWRGELPQVPDVVKQMMYEASIHSDLEVGANVFLVPDAGSNDEALAVIGSIQLGSGGGDERFPSISVIQLNWNDAVNAYLAGSEIPDAKSFLLSQRTGMSSTSRHLEN